MDQGVSENTNEATQQTALPLGAAGTADPAPPEVDTPDPLAGSPGPPTIEAQDATTPESLQANPPTASEDASEALSTESPSQDQESKKEDPPKLEVVKQEETPRELLSRLNELEGKVRQAEEEKALMLAAQRKNKETERTELLINRWGLIKEDYATLAPSIDEADPQTPEGKESLRQWMVANQNLFKGAPSLPTEGEKQTTKKRGLFNQRATTWREIFNK